MTALALTGGAWKSPARRFHDEPTGMLPILGVERELPGSGRGEELGGDVVQGDSLRSGCAPGHPLVRAGAWAEHQPHEELVEGKVAWRRLLRRSPNDESDPLALLHRDGVRQEAIRGSPNLDRPIVGGWIVLCRGGWGATSSVKSRAET